MRQAIRLYAKSACWRDWLAALGGLALLPGWFCLAGSLVAWLVSLASVTAHSIYEEIVLRPLFGTRTSSNLSTDQTNRITSLKC